MKGLGTGLTRFYDIKVGFYIYNVLGCLVLWIDIGKYLFFVGIILRVVNFRAY